MNQYSDILKKCIPLFLGDDNSTTYTDPDTGEVLPHPPSSNTGGKFPNPYSNFDLSIDWLAFTIDEKHLKKLANIFTAWFSPPTTRAERRAGKTKGFSVGLIEKKTGRNGYTKSASIVAQTSSGPLVLGLCAWGGDSQKGKLWVSLPGNACQSILSWPLVQRTLTGLDAKLNRVDLALDDFDGLYGVEYAYAQRKEGAFNAGGRTPEYMVIGDWLEPTGAGRTLNIGKRGNGKFLRIYEKGRQLGDPNSVWTRWEYEITAKDRIVSLDILTNPLDYFAGCSPAAAALVEAHPIKIKTTPRAVLEATLERIVGNVKTHSGKSLHILTKLANGDAAKVLEMVSVIGLPGSLKNMPIVFDDSWVQLGIDMHPRDDRQGSLAF